MIDTSEKICRPIGDRGYFAGLKLDQDQRDGSSRPVCPLVHRQREKDQPLNKSELYVASLTVCLER